ncbi:hypothetical protein PENSPDRAFT_757433 [Peniophora sp. CONT]|nr:hypothetical protein PENSPDRAFT_757433 [Peniophora sp. CONT]
MPISADDIPDDIVVELFFSLAAISTPYSRSTYSSQADLGWIILTHVCRRWRAIGLTISVLWSEVATVFPQGINTMLSRCNDRPIDIDFSSSTSSAHATRLAKLLPRAYRVFAMRWEHCRALMGVTMPHLQTLILISDGSRKRDFIKERKYAALVAPILSSCTLVNLCMPLVAPKITSLTITDLQIGARRLLQILRSCPSLAKLSVHGGLHSIESGIAYRQPPVRLHDVASNSESSIMQALPSVRLPCLKSASLHGYTAAVLLVLMRLEAPSSASFDIEYDPSPIDDKIEGLRHLILSLHTQISVLPVLAVTHSEDPYGYQFFFETDSSFREDAVAHTSGYSPGVRLKTLISTLVDAIPLIMPLAIHTLAFIPGENWWLVLPNNTRLGAALLPFHSVTTVYVRGDCGVLEALNSHYNMNGDSDIALPSLHTLILHQPLRFAPLSQDSWHGLVAFLRMRQAAHAKVLRLVLRGQLCHVNAAPRVNIASTDEYDWDSDVDSTDSKDAGWTLDLKEVNLDVVHDLVDELVDERCGACHCGQTRKRSIRTE